MRIAVRIRYVAVDSCGLPWDYPAGLKVVTPEELGVEGDVITGVVEVE